MNSKRRPVSRRIRSLAREIGYRSYFRLVSLNYRTRLFARRNRTHAGTVRCYELLNRHGDDEMLAAMAAECDSDAVIYDVGANVGIYALSLADGHPERKVVAFEPSPAVLPQLGANVEVNEFGDRITVTQAGLGAETGEETFYLSTYPELSGFDRESATRWEAEIAETVRVPVSTLDVVTQEKPAPEVIKIDVEGAGPQVLAGGRETLRESRPTLYIETHCDGLAGDPQTEMESLLREAAYSIDKRDGYWRCIPS